MIYLSEQSILTCSKLPVETINQYHVEFVQSYQKKTPERNHFCEFHVMINIVANELICFIHIN